MADQLKERPEGLTDEMLEYLDDLREGGSINMLGAAAPLANEFALYYKSMAGNYRPNLRKARSYLVYWMETFGNESR